MSGKHPNGRLIKTHRCFTVAEAAQALGVARVTVRRHMKDGLPCLNDQRPLLIFGKDLEIFLYEKR